MLMAKQSAGSQIFLPRAQNLTVASCCRDPSNASQASVVSDKSAKFFLCISSSE